MENGIDIASIERISKQRFSFATRVQLLWKGRESFQILFDAVSRAERFVCLQFYIIKDDDTGKFPVLCGAKQVDGIGPGRDYPSPFHVKTQKTAGISR